MTGRVNRPHVTPRQHEMARFCKGVPTEQLERANAEGVGLAELIKALDECRAHVHGDPSDRAALIRSECDRALAPFTSKEAGE